ncbi:hypothetical protein LTR56_004857 [Elasticomyces elasticus]|nr:hypothetical protein LTR56_004857 [Elasticomyces elasticus]KAK3664631.1 hypothetical protein LTR22_004499 [Elasticomyces elasticus]KAK4918401.1 hypothetical protein LTR49_013793 [Elasticomyces elasticus]KAK5760341.1 hypothetical protein LTS12_009555 [Elasticomyces elasticus]
MDAKPGISRPAEQGVSPMVAVKAEPDQDMKHSILPAATPQQPAGPAVTAVPGPVVEEIFLAPRRIGDVTIVLTNGSRVRVHSAVLTLASCVFEKMLGVGQALRSADAPQEIELLDGPEATIMLLRAIHLHPMLIPGSYSAGDIALKLARLGAIAAKYKCALQLSSAVEAVMLRAINAWSMVNFDVATTMSVYARCASAAYLLDMDQLFNHYTRRLVLDTTTSFTEIQDIEGCSQLPTSVILSLEEQRSALREELIATISARTNGKCQTLGCSQYSTSGTFAEHITRRLSVPHWPLPWTSTTLRTLLQQFKNTGDVQLGHTYPVLLKATLSKHNIEQLHRKFDIRFSISTHFMTAMDPGSNVASTSIVAETSTAPQNVTIVEEGDVILVLDDGKKRIKVSAALLSMASPVFKAMLGPHFLEGQVQRSPENPQNIHLPEDDPEAMVTLSKLVHFDTPHQSALGPGSLRKVAVLADKYDCTHAISLQAETLLNRHARSLAFCRGNVQDHDILPLLACFTTSAYLLRKDVEFGHFTRCMVLDIVSPYSAVTEIEGCESFPISVLLSLEEQRTMTRDVLVSTLYARTSGE